MAPKNTPRNRAMNDRLWDEDGRVWYRPFKWLDRDEVDSALQQHDCLVVHRYRDPLLWLRGQEARDWWVKVRPHTQTSEEEAVHPDDEDLTYAAALWTSEEERLLVVEASC